MTLPEGAEPGTPQPASKRPPPAWLKPLPVRLALVAIPFVWAAIEAYAGDLHWAMLVAILGVWGVVTLVLRYEG